MPKPQSSYEAAAQQGALDDKGRVLNPHIPSFIGDAPWWYTGGNGAPGNAGLAHQRLQTEEKTGPDQWLKRGRQAVAVQPSKTHFEPGACTNCGARTHDAKNCLERPRKAGAWKTETDLRPDDVAQPSLKLSFDGVHDRYNGYDAEDDARRIKQFKQVKVDKEGAPSASVAVAAAGAAATGAAAEKKPIVLPTSLRQREDTAKYLRNLAADSAYYDPKTRSMRGNPTPHLPPEELLFSGDNFIRKSGEAAELEKIELFAQRAPSADKSAKTAQANPTELLLARREFELRKQAQLRAKKDLALSMYGGAEHLGAPKLEASMSYAEWSADGRLIKSGDGGALAAKSRFAEDVLESNHSAVWGSFFDARAMAWGYACCHQCMRSAWCTGEEGKRALGETHAA